MFDIHNFFSVQQLHFLPLELSRYKHCNVEAVIFACCHRNKYYLICCSKYSKKLQRKKAKLNKKIYFIHYSLCNKTNT